MDTKKIVLFLLVSLIGLFYLVHMRREQNQRLVKEKIVFRCIVSENDNLELNRALNFFSQKLKEKTKEQILVEIYYNGESENAILDSVKMGTIDISKINVGNIKIKDKAINLIEGKEDIILNLKGYEGQVIKENFIEREPMAVPLGFLTISKSNLQLNVYMLIISKLSWDNLNDVQKKLVIEAVKETENYLNNRCYYDNGRIDE